MRCNCLGECSGDTRTTSSTQMTVTSAPWFPFTSCSYGIDHLGGLARLSEQPLLHLVSRQAPCATHLRLSAPIRRRRMTRHTSSLIRIVRICERCCRLPCSSPLAGQLGRCLGRAVRRGGQLAFPTLLREGNLGPYRGAEPLKGSSSNLLRLSPQNSLRGDLRSEALGARPCGLAFQTLLGRAGLRPKG